MIFLIILAILPAQSQNSPASSGVSTYIVVFNGSSGGISAASSNKVADLVSSYGGDVKYRYHIVNGMAVTMPDSQAGQLRELPNVKYVEKDELIRIQLDQAVPQIGADQVWAEGYNGSGVKV
ncbi:MAG TPA: protease inhibitor I9 family protein, partial [Methanocella sp.]|nr:protease inhibitor I9 family protein [Methanocella sp.]